MKHTIKNNEFDSKLSERNNTKVNKANYGKYMSVYYLIEEKMQRRNKDSISFHKSYDEQNKDTNIVNKKNISMKIKDK